MKKIFVLSILLTMFVFLSGIASANGVVGQYLTDKNIDQITLGDGPSDIYKISTSAEGNPFTTPEKKTFNPGETLQMNVFVKFSQNANQIIVYWAIFKGNNLVKVFSHSFTSTYNAGETWAYSHHVKNLPSGHAGNYSYAAKTIVGNDEDIAGYPSLDYVFTLH